MLFRSQALSAQRSSALGSAILARPLSLTILTILFGGCALALILFSILASYTRHTTVSGQIVPDQGLLTVVSPQPGVILTRLVNEGDSVTRGQALFTLSGERASLTRGDALAAVARTEQRREDSLHLEIARLGKLEAEERAGLARRIDSLASQAAVSRNEIETEQARRTIADRALQRFAGLAQEGFVTRDQLESRRTAVLEIDARISQLVAAGVALQREIDDLRAQLLQLPDRYANQVASLEQSLESAEQSLVDTETERGVSVVAPLDGVVASVTAVAGQAIDQNRPLAALVPVGARLCAELYAPSRAIGFVRTGQAVRLRIDAYPYQRFGVLSGQVEAVAQASVPAADLSRGAGAVIGTAAEPVYRITIRLPEPGGTPPLIPRLIVGMHLEADLQQERRQVYQWIIDPLAGLAGLS